MINIYKKDDNKKPTKLLEKRHGHNYDSMEADMLKRKGYFINSLLGEGTYSKVKRANSTSLQQQVAIKIISRDSAPRPFRERFLPREIKILSQVHHPNIVHVYEIFETRIPKRVYIVTEIMGCGDLLELIKENGPLQENYARVVISDVCKALCYLHNRQIVHRDIKCENILLNRVTSTKTNKPTEPGVLLRAKICDFGFARHFEHDRDDTQDTRFLTNTFCGSAAYASPEILERRTYDAMLADVWALGIVVFITLYGSMPFDDSDIKAMVVEQKKANVVEDRAGRVSASAKIFLTRALQPNPVKRCKIVDLLHHRWLMQSVASKIVTK